MIGPTGPTGATGPTGVTGPTGGNEAILAIFASDQTISDKFIGLGQQANDHPSVSVIMPKAICVKELVVKVTQGNTPRTGSAELYTDNGPTGTPTGIACMFDADPGSATCNALCPPTSLPSCQIEKFDGLSLRIIADSGSFAGASGALLADIGTCVTP